jgi:hypothetical protein
MCYLVTYIHTVEQGLLPSNGKEPFRTAKEAEDRAVILCQSDDITEVKVWKLHGAPTVKKTVEWNTNE